MNLVATIILSVITFVLLILFWLVISLKKQLKDKTDARVDLAFSELKTDIISRQMEGMISLRESLDSANRLLNERLTEGQMSLDRRMAPLGDIENKLGQLAKQTENLEVIGGNIQKLSDILKPPKMRGAFGEMMLENLLGEMLPSGLYEMQYQFSGGQRADAVIKLADKMLSIDSKFPLDSFERIINNNDEENTADTRDFKKALKKHIEAISDKYIQPGNGTLDFAIMYIPSEAVYYHLISDKDLDVFKYALAKKVIPSSPGHLYGFLASLAELFTRAGLAGRGDTPEENQRILNCLREMSSILERTDILNDRINGSLRSLNSNISKANEEWSRLSVQIDLIRDSSLSTKSP